MLAQVIDFFEIKPDTDLNLMTANQTLSELLSRIIQGLEDVFNQTCPDIVLVQGSKFTTFSIALLKN